MQSGYENALSQSYFYLDGAEELLDELSQKYRLFVVSNGTAKVQDGRIALSGIGKYFEQIFISQRVGYDKPNPKFLINASSLSATSTVPTASSSETVSRPIFKAVKTQELRQFGIICVITPATPT